MRVQPLAVLGAVALCGLILSGCSTGSAGGPATTEPTETTPASDIQAAWLDDGRGVAVITYGSSSCVPTVVSAGLYVGTLAVELADPEGDTACTADYAPRATYVPAPEAVDPGAQLNVEVSGDYSGTVMLAGDDALTGTPGEPTEYAPSAGWAGEGMLVILTWGSSSCPPVIEGVEATGASEVTVTFETPPEDQVCTMDMAPRTTITAVDGLEEPAGATLVLTGDQYDGVQVAIAGTP